MKQEMTITQSIHLQAHILCSPEQHSVRHVLDDGLVGGAVLEPDGVAHLLPEQAPELLRHALRHRHGRHAPRLRAPDLAPRREPRLRDVLRELRRLPRPRLADHDQDLLNVEFDYPTDRL